MILGFFAENSDWKILKERLVGSREVKTSLKEKIRQPLLQNLHQLDLWFLKSESDVLHIESFPTRNRVWEECYDLKRASWAFIDQEPPVSVKWMYKFARKYNR